MSKTGPTPKTRATVLARCDGHCERCGHTLTSQASLHHRRPRRMGGTKRVDVNLPPNLLVLCGSGTTGCHGWIESHRTEGYDDGIILYDADDPAEKPYRDSTGTWWQLTPNGGRNMTTASQHTLPGLG